MTAPALDTRWWAPAAPGIGPDDRDLFLLAAQGDGPQDLGQHLLALHRVGAAACEAVATQPLADESVLCEVLATTRGLLAPPAVQAVSKAVDDPAYGGLLVRDVLDDAEAAALSLWRTQLARYVPAPVAAHRVGLVYGVPLAELGRYTALARDPKAQEVALVAEADKALFGYVAKMVAEEGVESRVTFSKAPADYLQRHNETQDTTGRFIRLDASLAAESETKPERATTPGRLSSPEQRGQEIQGPATVGRTSAISRRGKLQRGKLKRGTLVRDAEGNALRAVAAPAERVEAQRISAQRVAARLTTAQRDVAARLAALEIARPLTGIPRDVPDPLGDYGRAEFTDKVKPSLAFAMPADEWAQFNSEMGITKTKRVARAGALRAYLETSPVAYETDDSEEAEVTPEHLGNVEAIARDLLKDPRVARAEPRLRMIPAAPYVGLSLADTERKIRAEKEAFAMELGLPRAMAGAVMHASLEEDRSHLVLVWQPEVQQRKHIRRVTEVVVESAGVNATNHGTDRHPQYEIGRNQPLLGTGAASDVTFVMDDDGGYFKYTVKLTAGDEDDITTARRNLSKAASSEFTPDRRETPYYDGRLHGRFARATLLDLIAPETETETVPEKTTSALQRRSKLTRGKLKRAALVRPTTSSTTSTSAVSTPAERTAATRTEATRNSAHYTPAEQAKATRLIAEIATRNASGQTVLLDDAYTYGLLDPADVTDLYHSAAAAGTAKWTEDLLQGSHPVPIGLQTRLMGRDNQGMAREMDELSTRAVLVDEQAKRFIGTQVHGQQFDKIVRQHRVQTQASRHKLAIQIADYLESNPGKGYLRLNLTPRADGWWDAEVSVNAGQMPALDLMRFTDGVRSGPLEASYENTKPYLDEGGIADWIDMVVDSADEELGGRGPVTHFLANPRVNSWVVTPASNQP